MRQLLTSVTSSMTTVIMILYDYPNNDIVCIHFNAALAINATMKETFHTKLYEELGLESSRFRNLFRLLCNFFKIKTSGKPEYHSNVIQMVCILTTSKNYENFYCRTDTFKNLFFQEKTAEWIKIDADIQKAKSYTIFWNVFCTIRRPNQFFVYTTHNYTELKLVTRLRLCLINVNEHRFNHNFQCCIKPLCSCSLKTETTAYLLLHCHHF